MPINFPMFKRRRTRYNDKSNKEYLDTIARQFFNKCYDKYDKKLSKYRSFKSLSMCLLRLGWVFYYQRHLVERKFKRKFLDLTKQRRLAMLTRSPRLSIGAIAWKQTFFEPHKYPTVQGLEYVTKGIWLWNLIQIR